MKYSAILVLVLWSTCTFAQRANDTIPLYLEFPVMDVPYQGKAIQTTGGFFTSYANPSMRQSLAISNNLYSAAHWGIKRGINTKSEFADILLRNLAAAAFDLFTIYSPLGYAWLHEEYHRAVMTVYGINSFNDMNTFPFGSSEVSVRKVLDENLIRLSDHHSTDFVRLMVAGNEGQYNQIQILQKQNFYYNQDLPHIPLYWMSTMTNIFYVNESSTERFDDLVDEVNESDGADVEKRDFTGPDFTAWSHALFNPEIPYTERGPHPSGVGINRYIKPSQLSDEALAYLKKQGNLQWLNVLSPHLFGFSKIRITSSKQGDYYGNLAIRHLLTSFGNDICLDVFLQTPENKFFVSIHNYNNYQRSFPGLEGIWIDKKLFRDKLLLSARAMCWLQPRDQSFTSDKASPGGLLGARFEYALGIWYPFVGIEGKTKGWVMGNEFMDENVRLNLGVNLRLRQ